MASIDSSVAKGMLVGFAGALILAAGRWLTPAVSAKNTIVYHGVVTPACERMPGQTGGEEWTSTANGTRCVIEFHEDISGAAVFVFGMGAVTSPASVTAGGRSISFQALGPTGHGNGFSFLLVK